MEACMLLAYAWSLRTRVDWYKVAGLCIILLFAVLTVYNVTIMAMVMFAAFIINLFTSRRL